MKIDKFLKKLGSGAMTVSGLTHHTDKYLNLMNFSLYEKSVKQEDNNLHSLQLLCKEHSISVVIYSMIGTHYLDSKGVHKHQPKATRVLKAKTALAILGGENFDFPF